MSTRTFAEQVLEWLLRRLQQGTPLTHDLILLIDHPLLEDLPGEVELGGHRWKTGAAVGEITLRALLPKHSGRLIARLTSTFPLPPDISGRAYLGNALEVRAEDVVAAMAKRFSEPIRDERLIQAIFKRTELLQRQTDRWTLGNYVTERQVRVVLLDSILETHALTDHEKAPALLQRWLLGGLPDDASPLVEQTLRETHGQAGHWLAQCLAQHTLKPLITTGALAASDEGWALCKDHRVRFGIQDSSRETLRAFVERALRDAWHDAAEQVMPHLDQAEALASTLKRADEEATALPLLWGPLQSRLDQASRRAAEGHPEDDSVLEALKGNLHAKREAHTIALVRDISRLARASTTALPPLDDWRPWCLFARDHSAWVDWCIRRVRRHLAQPQLPPSIKRDAQRVLERALSWRDHANRDFAQVLASSWPHIAASTNARQPLPLHHITRALVRKLIDHEKRVFLIILDGCDISTLIELIDSLETPAPFGLRLPDLDPGTLRDDLRSAFGVAVSPLPTLTHHARRALFAGELHGNLALDASESAAANASSDHVAWRRNNALHDTARRLFLKGDLYDGGAALRHTLEHGSERIVAAVFNAVDDALSSKETTPLDRWSFDRLGAPAVDAIQHAIEQGWTVLLTSDHGHTPFIGKDRKVSAKAEGARYDTKPLKGATRFDQGPLPHNPLYLLSQVGAWSGTQRRGWHGGAGLEEVVVPLVFLGAYQARRSQLQRPEWWWTEPSG